MTPSIRYINQTAPFWDFIHNMEDQAGDHPFFQQGGGPWGRPGWAHHGMPHRGGPSQAERTAEGEESNKEATGETSDEKTKDTQDEPKEPGEGPGCAGRRGKGRCGGGRHAWRHGHGHGWGGPRGYGYGGPWGVPRGFGFLSDVFQNQQEGAENSDWKPEADVFDSETAFVIHFSLPGAIKEDIGVSWDPDKSELSVAGVVHRPGDEEFLKKLALEERKVGAFERKVRLGTRTSPAQVDVEGITAKLENGILFVEVPKMKGDFVDVKKVDIE